MSSGARWHVFVDVKPTRACEELVVRMLGGLDVASKQNRSRGSPRTVRSPVPPVADQSRASGLMLVGRTFGSQPTRWRKANLGQCPCAHSAEMFAALATAAHFSISVRMMSRNSSGLVLFGSVPSCLAFA